jgi:transposase InsO family protein
VHVAVDDASRLAYVEVLPDQRGLSAVAFFERARRWFARQRIRIQRVMTDNGSAYVSRRFRRLCQRLGIRHLRTRPYRPQTNGKAERFIQTLLRGWAYLRPYRTSNQRTRALPRWLRYYNEERPHRSLGQLTPLLRAQRDR